MYTGNGVQNALTLVSNWFELSVLTDLVLFIIFLQDNVM